MPGIVHDVLARPYIQGGGIDLTVEGGEEEDGEGDGGGVGEEDVAGVG